MSEARRATLRIASNYVRLFITVSLGLYLTRILLQTLGNDGFGLAALLGSTTGFAATIEQVAGWSMIRELGIVHHQNDVTAFRKMYNSALLVSVTATALVIGLFAAIILGLQLLNIPDSLWISARWYVGAKAIETGVIVLVAPIFNMYLITERMVAYNLFLIARRASVVIGAVLLFWLNPDGDLARGLILYGWLSSGCLVFFTSAAVIIIMIQDRRLIPQPSLACRSCIKSILSIGGWNLATQTAVTLALPMGALIMNMQFGLQFGNLVFGLATRLGGYTRMLTSGMTVGLDAVAARLTAAERSESVRSLIRYSTTMHALVIFPAIVVVWTLADPILHVWIGAQVDQPQEMIPRIEMLVRIMLLGFLGMCLYDCWTRILYGAGHIRRYAKFVVVCNAIIPGLSVLFLFLFPESIAYTAVACAFSMIYLAGYAVLIPSRLSEAFHLPISEILSPLWRPLAISLVCSPILSASLWHIQSWDLRWLIIVTTTYAAAYAFLNWYFTISHDDRLRVMAAVHRVRQSFQAMRRPVERRLSAN